MTTIPDELVEAAKAAAAEAARPMRSFMDPVSDAAASCILANDALWRSALSAALPMLVRAEWQPIETAPKDGRHIIVARYMGDFGWVLGTSYWEDVRGISGWISRGLGPLGELGLGHPTHWMPLPAPPAIAAAIRARGER